ncbi:MAG: hypothetical protein ABI794_00795 [Betaproteobacteria bacterium]
MTEEQLKSLIKLAILELMDEHRDLFRELLREALRDTGERSVADPQHVEEEAKRAEILKLLGSTI